MKKLFILVAAALLSISANAQWYVGGRLGLDVNGNKTTSAVGTSNSTDFNFNLAPEVGYFLSDKLAVGGFLNINAGSRDTKVNAEIGEGDTGMNYTNFGWSIEPYVKYKFWGIGKFGIWGQAGVWIGTSTTKAKGAANSPVPSVNYGIEVLPVLTYSLNEHFTLDAYIDCVSLSYNGTSYNDKKNDIKSTSNSFGLGAATRGQILSVGFHYNF